MHLLLRQQTENGIQYRLHDVENQKDVECRVDFSSLSCKDLVITDNLLFAYQPVTHTVAVFEMRSGAQIAKVPLQDILGLTVTEGKIYIWNFDNEVFVVKWDHDEIKLEKLAVSVKDMNVMRVIRNTDEKFTLAMETFLQEVCLLTKADGVTKISVIKCDRHRLIGATRNHIYMFSEDTNEVVDYHKGSLSTFFHADGDWEFIWWRSRVCCGHMYAIYAGFEQSSSSSSEQSSEGSRSDEETEEGGLSWKMEIIETDSGIREILDLGFAHDVWHVCAVKTC